MKAAKVPVWLTAVAAGLLAASGGCASAPANPTERSNLTDDGQSQMKSLERDFPDVKKTIETSYGHAIFPSIAKGGLVFEAASGLGVVYEQGNYVGFSHLTLVNFGVVAGGEDYTELLVFQDKGAMDAFEANKLSFNANAEAVALKAGARAYPKFVDGVAIFIKSNSGFAIDASIGGQQFTFTRDVAGATTRPAAMAPMTPVVPATPANPLSPSTMP